MLTCLVFAYPVWRLALSPATLKAAEVVGTVLQVLSSIGFEPSPTNLAWFAPAHPRLHMRRAS